MNYKPQKQDKSRDNKGQFAKGCSGNPGGLPKGIRNKGTYIKLAFYAAFEKLGGTKALVAWAEKVHNRKEFYKLLAHMVPKEMDLKEGEKRSKKIAIIHPTEKEMREYRIKRGLSKDAKALS